MEDQRKLFCESVLLKGLTHAEACRQFGITRVTGYKWIERYKQRGWMHSLRRRGQKGLMKWEK